MRPTLDSLAKSMKRKQFKWMTFGLCGSGLIGVAAMQSSWPQPTAPVIPEADGYVAIPGAAVTPTKSRAYRAIFDGTRGPEKPGQLLPALNMAGSELNALVASDVPLRNVKFVIVF